MSTGHHAGLQKVHDFRDAERQIQEKRRIEAQSMVDRHGMGETVYRNELGQGIAFSQETQLNEREQFDLNKGRVIERARSQFPESVPRTPRNIVRATR
jgi:hypothetical protein